MRRLRTRRLYGVVFWTRHIRPFREGGDLNWLVSSYLSNPVINLTVTGLGGTCLEPGTPTTDEILGFLPELIRAFHDEPWRIRWRFDPVLKKQGTTERFERIAREMAANGVLTCTFSFPAYFSLKGDLSPAFATAGIARWREDEKRRWLASMVEIAAPLGMRLLSCAQPDNLAQNPYIEAAQCIPRDVLARGHPEGIPLVSKCDPSQRSKCRCIESEDIGNYETDRCLGGCVYCYSKAGGPVM
jgi:hypothetical protein